MPANPQQEKPGGGLALDPSITSKVRQLEEQHKTLRTQMYLQYGVLALSLGGVIFLAYIGKLDATVSALFATLLGYVLRGTHDRKMPGS